MIINNILFKYVFKDKKLLSGFIGLLENININVGNLFVLFDEPIGYEKEELMLGSIIVLNDDEQKPVLYCIELVHKANNSLLDYLNSEYIFLAKYREILANKNIKANEIEIRIIAMTSFIEYNDNLCIRMLKQYKSSFYIIELLKLENVMDNILRDFFKCLAKNTANEYSNRSDIVGVLARLIINENKNPRVIRELKQLEEARSALTLKYQAGYQSGMKNGYQDGFIDGKNEAINEIVLALHKQRLGKQKIAKIVNITEIEVKGIIDNNKLDTFSLNK
ncbi:MAG: hypothetical protein E7176_03495 [Erysipelotrichaceae bacterium]|nr:hypothetical protein [Erysipelotrichaceae bacterium]